MHIQHVLPGFFQVAETYLSSLLVLMMFLYLVARWSHQTPATSQLEKNFLHNTGTARVMILIHPPAICAKVCASYCRHSSAFVTPGQAPAATLGNSTEEHLNTEQVLD